MVKATTNSRKAKKAPQKKVGTQRIKIPPLGESSERINVKPMRLSLVTLRIKGVSPLIQHHWSEKAKKDMRDKMIKGKKTQDREPRDPRQEFKDAGYYTQDGKYGVLGVAIKAACIEAAHRDLGIAKVLVKKALFIHPMGRYVVLPLETSSGKGKVEANMGEDPVTVGRGQADLRYRPYFYDWGVTTTWQINTEQIQISDLINLLDRAGYGVGIHEWRPEKGGEFGRFQVDGDFGVIEKPFEWGS